VGEQSSLLEVQIQFTRPVVARFDDITKIEYIMVIQEEIPAMVTDKHPSPGLMGCEKKPLVLGCSLQVVCSWCMDDVDHFEYARGTRKVLGNVSTNPNLDLTFVVLFVGSLVNLSENNSKWNLFSFVSIF